MTLMSREPRVLRHLKIFSVAKKRDTSLNDAKVLMGSTFKCLLKSTLCCTDLRTFNGSTRGTNQLVLNGNHFSNIAEIHFILKCQKIMFSVNGP